MSPASLLQQRHTRIVATLGPATDSPDKLRALLAAGVDVVRLNLSHGTIEQQQARAAMVREISAALGREIGILADLPGPKIRIERFAEGQVLLQAGQRFDLIASADAPLGDASAVGVSYLGLPNDVQAGDILLLDDGVVQLQVDKVVPPRIHCRVLGNAVLSDRKGLNKRGGGLSLGALTDYDKQLIVQAAAMDVDFIAVSFCRNAQDMHEARQHAQQAGSRAALVAKIERAEAIVNLHDIIAASDVVMVARGDLGVEIGDAQLPGLQKKIIREALEQSKLVITATQMLQSMVHSPMPTRAEVLDVANAVIDGTDAVMLSAESAAGNYPVEAVQAMARICQAAEEQFEPANRALSASRALLRIDQSIAMATMFLTEHSAVAAIVALTESGDTARFLSRFRSTVPIYALSRHTDARRRMRMMRGVFALPFDTEGLAADAAAAQSLAQLQALGLVEAGDTVLLTSGDHMQQLGATNTLRVLQVPASAQAF